MRGNKIDEVQAQWGRPIGAALVRSWRRVPVSPKLLNNSPY